MDDTVKTPRNYRPDIDGLRALAVLAVVLFHANIPGFSGGFVGVDIFFVISGYLITSILFRELTQGTFSFCTFFERRVRRIIPALFVMVFTTIVVGYFVLLFPIDYRELGQSVFAQSIFLANFYFVRDSGYFSPLAENVPLLHTWTLSVEEQFYIAFPIFLFVVWRFFRKLLVPILVVLGITSFAISVYLLNVAPQDSFSLPHVPNIWGSATNAKVAFYLLPARAWEFIIGGLIAVTGVALHKKYQADIVAVLGLLAIIFSIIFFNKTTLFPGIAALLPVFGAAALIVSNTKCSTFVGQLFSFPLFVGVGLISYSLYLWHWPILVFTKQYLNTELSQQTTAFLVALSFVAAYISYRYVETPFRKKQLLKGRTAMLIGGLCALGLLATLGMQIGKNQGFINRAPVEARNVAAAAVDFGPRRNDCFVNSFSLGDEPCLLGMQDSKKVSFVLWGDSHAGGLLPLVDSMAKEYGYSGASFISPGCEPSASVPGQSKKAACNHVNLLAVQYIRAHAIQEILITSHWIGTEKNLVDIIQADTFKGGHFTIVHEPPKQTDFDMRQLFYSVTKGADISGGGISYQEYRKNQADALSMVDDLAQFSNVTILNPADILCDNNSCKLLIDGSFIYYDNRHINVTGAMALKPLFENFFRTLDILQ